MAGQLASLAATGQSWLAGWLARLAQSFVAALCLLPAHATTSSSWQGCHLRSCCSCHLKLPYLPAVMCVQEAEYLLLDEASVELPPEDDLMAAVDESMAAGPFNSTAW